MNSTTKNIAVIGAGIAGITAAYQLAYKGHRVTVYDQERYPGMKTSYANGSQLSVCNAQVWNTWHMIGKGLSDIFKPGAPFRLGLNPFDLDKIKWLVRFIRETSSGRADDNTARTIRMALASRAETLAIAEREGIRFDHVNKGILHIYTSATGMESARRSQEIMVSNGCRWDIISKQDCIGIEPSLASGPDLVGGVYTKDDSTGDMHKFVTQLALVLAERYSARVFLDHVVASIVPRNDGVDVDGEPYDEVVIASGVEAEDWAKKFGDRLGIYPIKGYSITIDLHTDHSRDAAPWVSILDEDAKIVCSRLGKGRLRIAGTAELAGRNLDIRQERIRPLIDWTRRWFPAVETHGIRPWAGLRPMTPDMLPIVGRGKNPRVWYHAGHGHLGWTLSAGTSNQLASMISGG